MCIHEEKRANISLYETHEKIYVFCGSTMYNVYRTFSALAALCLIVVVVVYIQDNKRQGPSTRCPEQNASTQPKCYLLS